MNIAITGPRRFAFQDLVCVELSLRFLHKSGAKLLVEPKDGEDVALLWHSWPGDRTLDVQIKDENIPLDVDRLTEMLMHFPERQNRDTRLERLMANGGAALLLVTSNRCDDRVAPLLAPAEWTGERRAAPATTISLAHEVLAAVERVASSLGKTPLALRRADHLRSNVAKLNAAAVAEALNSVFVAERETPAAVEVRVQERLRAAHGIASDNLRDVTATLSRTISDAKGAGDVLDRIRRSLETLSPSRVAPTAYVARGQEDQLAAALARDRILLLSGPPRAGKSWTARSIAGRLQLLGYDVRTGARTEEAERFLSDPGGSDRAFVLDDPLGSRSPVPGASTELASLRALVAALPPNRRLIVSQGREPLLVCFRAVGLPGCRLGGVDWHDLGAIAPSASVMIWRQEAARLALGPEATDRVATLIAEREDLREPGALLFLAATFDDLPVSASPDAIVAHSRRDALDVSQDLASRHEGMEELLVGLAVCTGPSCPVKPDDLAFALGSGGKRPTAANRLGRAITFGGPSRPPSPLPKYAPPPALIDSAHRALDTLLRLRFATCAKDVCNFSHPFFRAGAQALVDPASIDDVRRAAGYVDGALFCMSPRTSSAAARALPWLAEAAAAHPDASKLLVDLAEAGLRSRFPATRDLCFNFLLDESRLDRTRGDKLRSWAGLVMIRFEDVEEHDGVAWIDDGESDSSDILERMFGQSDVADVEPYLNAIEVGGTVDLDFGLSRRLLDALATAPERMTGTVFLRMLSIDEGMIRARAVAIWLGHPRTGDNDLIARIARDRHPAVAVAALRAVALGWGTLDHGRRTALAGSICLFAEAPACAIVMFLELVTFDRVERYGKAPPWPLFAAVLPATLAQLPNRLTYNDGRLVVSVSTAVESLAPNQAMPLLKAWVARIRAQLFEQLPSDYELAVIPSLLDATATEPALRAGMVQELLEIDASGSRLVFSTDLVDRWSDLTDDERGALVGLLRSTEPGTRWAKAAAITRRAVPPEVEEAVLGGTEILSLGAAELVSKTPLDLLEACLQLCVGAPQPLWWLGKHHPRSSPWVDALAHLADSPSSPFFAIAFDDALAYGEDENIERMIAAIDKQHLELVFDRMLARKAACVGEWKTGAWSLLLDRGLEQGPHIYETWIDRIVAAAPTFLDDLTDVRSWFGATAHAEAILKALNADLAVFATTNALRMLLEPQQGAPGKRRVLSQEICDGAAALAERFLDLVPQRQLLHGTWSELADALRDCCPTGSEQIVERLVARSSEVIYSMRPDREAPRNLADWVGPE
jgi:hypothetical protein